MLSSSQRKGGPQANPAMVPPGALPQELAADLARYRTLAEQLAVQRKSGQAGGRLRRLHVDCPAAGAPAASLSLARAATNPRTGRTTLAVGAILAAGLVLSSPAAWLRIEGRDAKASGTWEGAGEASGQDTQAEWQPAIADPAGVNPLLPLLESALIDSTAQAAALANLRVRLQQAEALSDSYATRLVQELAHSRILEEALTAREAEASLPVPPNAPSPPEGTPLTEALPSSVESLQPIAESRQSTAEPLQPAEAVRAPVLPAAGLDHLMLRARQLLEQGDIAAARIVLESTADSGHGPALFQLAETYDPATLSIWRTFGTKGDLAKARELYLKAEQAGVVEATERLKSLPH